ncbi:MAG: ABC transporter permease [Spirochaeta sp.]|jgi:ABC-type dipeptide/oligopeptide/nickel transport system permease subunit|nr:ABC transporter permease [Spirochaeta sp.]
MKARTLWTWAAVNIIALFVTLPSVRDSLDHSVSWGILAAVALTVVLTAVRVARSGEAGEIKSVRYLIWQKLRKNRIAMLGMGVVIALLYAAMLSPFVTPQDPYAINWAAIATGPSDLNVFGTDDLGRDVLSRAIFGLRIVIGVSVLAVIVNMVLGTVFGLVAGYYGGVVDALIMRVLEMWNSIPFILLAIALMAALGAGLFNLVLVVSLSGIMQLARLIRGQVLVIRKSQFVDAAKVMGVPGPMILLRHILPHTIGPIVVMSTLKIGETILTISGLSFLGLGIQPPMPSLGGMLAVGQQFLYQNVLMSVVPGVLILLTVLSFNLLGDGLRDAFDSRLR